MNLNNEQVAIANGIAATLRVICFALIIGVSLFAVISFGITDWNTVSTKLDILPLIGIGLGAFGIAQSFVLPGLFTSAGVKAANEGSKKDKNEQVRKLAGVFQTKTIFGFAFLEGAAFLNLLIFFVGRNLLPLSVAGFALAIMIIRIPRNHSVIEWIEDRMES